MWGRKKEEKPKLPVYLVTGESGMIGSAIVEALEAKQRFVLRLTTGDAEYFTNQFYQSRFNPMRIVKNREVDICCSDNIDHWDKRLDDVDLDRPLVIIHTAAYVNTDKCDEDPYIATKVNVTGTQHMIDLWRRQWNKGRDVYFIYFSTTAVFDPNEYMTYITPGDFHENSRIDPKTLYGLTKYQGEMAVKQSIPKGKLLVIKPVFVYGDEPQDNSSQIRKILTAIHTDEPHCVTLNRNGYKDYFRIEYFTEMFMKMIDVLEHSELKSTTKVIMFHWQDFILARGRAATFQRYLEIIKLVTGKDPFDYITLDEDADYLRDHCPKPVRYENVFGPAPFSSKDVYDNHIGIMKTWVSIQKEAEASRTYNMTTTDLAGLSVSGAFIDVRPSQ